MAQSRKGSKINSKINMFIYGAPFSGKSTLGMQLALLHTKDGRPFRLLVIDGEQGGVDDLLEPLEREGVNLDNILIIYTQSLQETLYYIEKATKQENFYELDEDGNETSNVILDADGKPFRVDALLLDGSSVLRLTSEQSLLELARRRAKIKANKNNLTGEERKLAVDDVAMSQREWGSLNRNGQELVLDLAASGLHWVITAREKEITQTKIVNGKEVVVHTGKYTFDSFKNMNYNTKTNVRLYRDDDDPETVKMFVEKDRTNTFPLLQVVDDPTLLPFQAMIDKQNGNDIIVKNSMKRSIEIDEELYDKSLGLDEDSNTQQDSHPEAVTQSANDLKKQVKAYNKEMTLTQKASFGERLRAEELPVTLSKIEDPAILSRMIDICREIMEAE